MGEQFTKGPWKFKQASGKMYATLMADGSMLAIFRRPVSDADGQLIASCPDLVEALRGLVRWHIKRGPFDEPLGASEQEPEINAAVAALSRATGEG